MTTIKGASPSSPSSQKPRICTREACDTCRDKKAKCSGGKPCTRCAQRNIDCIYESRNYRTKRSLRDEIATLKRRNREKDQVIEGLRHEHEHDQKYDQKQDQGQFALPSPRSSVVSTQDHQSDSTTSPLSQQESPFFDADSVPDASNGFVGLNAGSSQMACDLLQAESTVSPQGVPVLNSSNAHTNGYDPGFYLPWSGFDQTQVPSYPAHPGTDRSLSFGTEGPSISQDVDPMFTLHNPDAIRMGSTMDMPQMEPHQTWNAYQPNPLVAPASQPGGTTDTAPTPPLSPFAMADSQSAPAPAVENRPASRERHRLASARNWRKQKTATADLQATKQRVEAEHTSLQSQYAEVAEQVRFVKNALLTHAGCDDPAIGRWLENEVRSVGGRQQARPKEHVRHSTGKRNHADGVGEDGSEKSRKHVSRA
ncbi:hypothetical protein ACHAQH_009967 [Verticillium albo-atrum]